MDKLSICYISFNYYPGQGVTAFYEFSRKMRDEGHNVLVLAAARRGEKRFEIVDGVVIIRIPVKTTRKRSLENLRFTILASRALSNVIEKNHIQIVHVFSYAFASLIKFKIFPSSKKVKWIYDIRSGPVLDNMFYQLGNKLLRFEASLFDKTFIIDEMVNNEIFGNQKKKGAVIVPLGVDLNVFKPERNPLLLSRYGILENDTVLVYLGNLNSERRIQNVIMAFGKASKKIKGLRLMIIGDGNSLPDLKLLAKNLSISDKVIFLGYIDYSKVPSFLSATDIAISYIPIVPAFDAQPPIKTVEYLACSLPVIATSTKGNQRFITHERNGLLSEDDPYSLLKAITRLCIDVNLRNKLGKNARPSIVEYDWRTIVKEKILPAYQEVLRD